MLFTGSKKLDPLPSCDVPKLGTSTKSAPFSYSKKLTQKWPIFPYFWTCTAARRPKFGPNAWTRYPNHHLKGFWLNFILTHFLGKNIVKFCRKSSKRANFASNREMHFDLSWSFCSTWGAQTWPSCTTFWCFKSICGDF